MFILERSMAGRIPQHFIDELLSRTDIVDIIDTYVPLRKAGKNHQALCPFHDEKTPSFTVSQDKQFYHCFGCGANGTAISFLMDYNHLGFIEAVEELANRAGLEIPREAGHAAKSEGFAEFYELMEMIVDFYRKQLREHPQAQRAVDYLKRRGLTGELAAQFELGYAPAGWDSLLKHFGQSDAAQQRLNRIGMIIPRDTGGYYDRFRDRIMFPIRDQRGRTVGFGGRVIDEGTPKYLNSPETPIFHKGRELYGLYQARRKHKELENLFLVEGYMDVLALAQHGIDNAAATLGTAATTDHLELVFRNTGQVVFCFDGDEAGQKAAARAMETTLPLLRDGRQAFFLFMPEGEDPDSLVRKQGNGFFKDTAKYLPLSDYLINTLKSQNDLSTREGRSRMVEQALPYLSKLPQGALRQMILRDLATLSRIPAGDIEPLVKNSGQPYGRGPRPQAKIQNKMMTPISHLISLILYRPDLALLIDEPLELAALPEPGAPFLKELVEFIHGRPNITCAGIIENWRDSKYEARLKELTATSDILLSELHDLDRELLDAVDRLRAKKRKQDRKKSTTVSRMSDLSDEGKAELRNLISSRNLSSKK